MGDITPFNPPPHRIRFLNIYICILCKTFVKNIFNDDDKSLSLNSLAPFDQIASCELGRKCSDIWLVSWSQHIHAMVRKKNVFNTDIKIAMKIERVREKVGKSGSGTRDKISDMFRYEKHIS